MTEAMKDRKPEIDYCVGVFIQMIQLSSLRYERHDLTRQIDWIFETIIENDLDGAILGGFTLTSLRKQSDYRLSVSQLSRLLGARVDLEKKTRPKESFRLLPFEFEVAEWCRLDTAKSEDIQAFETMCSFALSNGFIGFHWMPKFLRDLDPAGDLVAQFVVNHLSVNLTISPHDLARLAYLASGYADTSKGWALIAAPICKKAAAFSREERERVFFGLSRKETGVLSSTPGEVPNYYFETRDAAVRMQSLEASDSALRGYREWAVRRAEADLLRQRQMREEVGNE
jgi:hypothetical protein